MHLVAAHCGGCRHAADHGCPAAAGSETQALDHTLSTWLQGPVSDELKSKWASLIKKYIVFCVDTGRPVLPADILALFRYALWLPDNGVPAGWNSVRQ